MAATKRKLRKVGRKKSRIRPVYFSVKFSLNPQTDQDLISLMSSAPDRGLATMIISRLRNGGALESQSNDGGMDLESLLNVWGAE